MPTIEPMSAGHPIEAPLHIVGRESLTLTDPARGGRNLAVEVWYPARPGSEELATYELFPGVAFRSSHARQSATAMAGQWPLVVFSHGRTGSRLSYSTFCEALAARGSIVVAADHPGDVLVDWLTMRQTDDRTNEIDRVADAHLLLQAFLHGDPAVPVGVLNAIDHRRVALAGHSYGAYTAFATAAGTRERPLHMAVCAVMGFQSYTRTMSDGMLGRIEVPVLMVVSARDQVTPPRVDAERPWALLRSEPVWRLDMPGAGHQAISDIALYAELAEHVADLPDLVRTYLTAAAQGTDDATGRTWRDLLRIQLDTCWAFLQIALDIDPDDARETVRRLEEEPRLSLKRR
jgi:predicted dienelactone hydrolase